MPARGNASGFNDTSRYVPDRRLKSQIPHNLLVLDEFSKTLRAAANGCLLAHKCRGFTFEVQQLGWEEGTDTLSRAGRMLPPRLIAPYGPSPATSQRQPASTRWRECMCRSVQ